MKIKISSLVKYVFLAAAVSGSYSCRKMFDTQPQNKVESKNAYQNIYDADAAVMGVYGKFIGLASQYEVLNELRADLMDITPNAGADLQQINAENVQPGNTYADPRPFYAVIMNCNDVLENLKVMFDNHKLTEDDYDQRMSDIGALRSWIYFQLGLQYGTVPYITESISNINDITNESKFPRVKLDDLVQTLITYLNSLPYHDPYPAANSLIANSISGYPSKMFFVNKKCLLGDLYLWSNDYHNAAITYKQVMETTTAAGTADSYAYYNTYTLNSGSDNDAVSISAWQTFFSRSMSDREFQTEWIWSIPFDNNFATPNPFVNLFANSGQGKYMLKPSQLAINNWGAQQQTDGTPVDYRGPNNTYKIVNGQPIIMKYLYNYLDASLGLPSDPLAKNGKWYLYRTPTLHLRFAEAANRDGQTKIAWALVNAGIKGAFNNPNVPDTLSRITLLPPPYDFDARKLDAPTIRGKYHRNLGIRARVNTTLLDTMIYHNNDVMTMEDKIVDEGALELAYEGNRWEDLLRVAHRRESLSPGKGLSFLESKVAAKFTAAGLPVPDGVLKLGANTDYWFLPFK
jgi:hypothetical protein